MAIEIGPNLSLTLLVLMVLALMALCASVGILWPVLQGIGTLLIVLIIALVIVS